MQHLGRRSPRRSRLLNSTQADDLRTLTAVIATPAQGAESAISQQGGLKSDHSQWLGVVSGERANSRR